jgi:hypothetical protein
MAPVVNMPSFSILRIYDPLEIAAMLQILQIFPTSTSTIDPKLKGENAIENN